MQPAKQSVQLASKFFIHFRRFYCTFSLNTEYSEAVVRRCFAKKVLLKILQNSLENTCARFTLLIKFFNKIFLLKKETLAQVFSCEFCNYFKNTFFYRTTLVTASEYQITRKESLLLANTNQISPNLNLHSTLLNLHYQPC